MAKCSHRELIFRLQKQRKFGEQRGYCSQQCKMLIKVIVPDPTLHKKEVPEE